MAENHQFEKMLTPQEVAERIKVNPKTVTRWARAGRVRSMRTIGGHRRIPESEVARMLQPDGAPDMDGGEHCKGQEEEGAGDARA